MDMGLPGKYPILSCNLVCPCDQILFDRIGTEITCADISVMCLPLSLSPFIAGLCVEAQPRAGTTTYAEGSCKFRRTEQQDRRSLSS